MTMKMKIDRLSVVLACALALQFSYHYLYLDGDWLDLCLAPLCLALGVSAIIDICQEG